MDNPIIIGIVVVIVAVVFIIGATIWACCKIASDCDDSIEKEREHERIYQQK